MLRFRVEVKLLDFRFGFMFGQVSILREKYLNYDYENIFICLGCL